MEDVYKMRPFKIRNADEYDLSQILKLFISPFEGLSTPFDFENNIIKGRMGSGKTMYLRANYAYYLYSIVPKLIENEELIIPIFIRLSDFQHITEPSEIYRAIIIKIIEEFTSIYINLKDSDKMAQIHRGFKTLPKDLLSSQKVSKSLEKLTKLGAKEYVEKISVELGFKGGVQPKFIKLSSEYKNNRLIEVKEKINPGIKDINEIYELLLKERNGKMLLLIDEAGSLDKKFFKGKDAPSFFEILMNQFRTTDYIRTKIAIYPNSFQDILTETRYGDAIILEENVTDHEGYNEFRKKALAIINNYLNQFDGAHIKSKEVFEINENEEYGDSIEQLINASNGNMRRLMQLLDAAMEEAYSDHRGSALIQLSHVNNALIKHSSSMETIYTEPDREFLKTIATACKSRSTFKFQLPHMSIALNKYSSRSQEYNLLNVIEIGTGRKGTTYSFDYCYCIAHDIPTHYLTGSERINRDRSLKDGRWASRITKLSEEILQHASTTYKVEGNIEYIGKKGGGFIMGDDNQQYFFTQDAIIEEDIDKSLFEGRRVRFAPLKFGDTDTAQAIEIL